MYAVVTPPTNNIRLNMLPVISASRRVDLVACYPEQLAQAIRQLGPQAIHTLVLWTKQPAPLVEHKSLHRVLKQLSQIYLQLTVTGLGGSCLEPGVPHWERVLAGLGPIVELVDTPARICLRYDPLLKVSLPDGSWITNMDTRLFEAVVSRAAAWGIKRLKVSYITPYSRVLARLARRGYQLIEVPLAQVEGFILKQLMPISQGYGMELGTCVVPDWPSQGCIDGELLTRLHPERRRCSLAKDRGQRPACHCTNSVDIGQWYNCPNGCLYCYGNPV